MRKTAATVWESRDGFDRKLLKGIKLVFWLIILTGMALAVRKYLWN